VLGKEVFTLDKAPLTAPGSQRVPCPPGSVGTVLLTCTAAPGALPVLTAEPECEPVGPAVCDAVHSSCKDAYADDKNLNEVYKTSCDLCDRARAAAEFSGFNNYHEKTWY